MKTFIASALIALSLAAALTPANAFDARKFFDEQSRSLR